MIKKNYVFTFLFFFLFVSSNLQAKLFTNAYISFELPSQWECLLEGTEWLCTSQFQNNSKEAIIILTAKEVGPNDSLAHYENHLKATRTYPSRKTGKPVTSKVVHVKQNKIADQVWIDGFHLGSEIPNYYTRYLASIKNGLAILITFSAHQSTFTKYSNDFFRAVQSLRIVASKGLVNENPSLIPLRSKNETLGPGMGYSLPPNLMGEDSLEDEQNLKTSDNLQIYMGLGLLILAIVGYIFIKRKK